MVLYHIGRTTARIPISIMDTGLLDHVFPQVIDSNVHQLAGIQSAASQMGLARRVSSPAVKAVDHAYRCQGMLAHNGVVAARMPGEYAVQMVKYAVAGEIHLGAAIFLGRAAVKNDSAAQSGFLHIVLNRYRSRGRSHA